jgi:hypothetical protein
MYAYQEISTTACIRLEEYHKSKTHFHLMRILLRARNCLNLRHVFVLFGYR